MHESKSYGMSRVVWLSRVDFQEYGSRCFSYPLSPVGFSPVLSLTLLKYIVKWNAPDQTTSVKPCPGSSTPDDDLRIHRGYYMVYHSTVHLAPQALSSSVRIRLIWKVEWSRFQRLRSCLLCCAISSCCFSSQNDNNLKQDLDDSFLLTRQFDLTSCDESDVTHDG